MSGRRRPIGAELSSGGVHFRVWAPARREVSVVVEHGSETELAREAGGYFSGLVQGAGAGTRYRFRLDREEECYPDPASRFQPEGPHGPSEVVDPYAYEWKHDWKSRGLKGMVISEVHVGTFTGEGTFAAAIEKLPLVADAGINTLEVLPVNEFPGSFGWGYDGVDVWAPMHHYGTPDDFRRFIDAAHAQGLAVMLDVVYNHLGPDGCYLSRYTPSYFTKKYENDWGDSLNFDGSECAGVREFFEQNAAYWIDEFRLDGLRLDATQSLNDDSPTHIVESITRCAREAAGGRRIVVTAENEPQNAALVKKFGVDAMWNDDWHHSAMVALTGRREAYYTDYAGSPQEFVSMAKLGFLYQGQRYKWQKNRRGTPSIDVPPMNLVCYLQNHDQIANSAHGQRIQCLTSPGRVRATTTLLLLAPQTPLLFQGQEFAASAPFVYFADHATKLAGQVAAGRREFLRQFPSIADAAIQESLPPPHERNSFLMSKVDWSDRERHAATLQLHRDLLRMRREDVTFAAQRSDVLHGAVLGPESFLLRWTPGGSGDRLLIVNLGRDLHLDPAPEPLLAPPENATWEPVFSTESAEYGGSGTSPLESDNNWRIPGHAAVVLRAIVA